MPVVLQQSDKLR